MSMLLGERVTLTKWGWLILAFSGVILLMFNALSHPERGAGIMGMAMALGAAFFYALTALIARRLQPLPAQHIAFIQMLVGIVLLLPLAHFSAITR